ncbi:asparagine synthase (glutamine-hydrolyzing) [Desulfovibrio sp. JC010]|uniref:asparagine synthase (glutamine-hydrolyzing) n=1 Tax=Desulfovibrio sp. JC010 TaxID=2593641 RepID=UPI0013D50E8A|nr:asparagine synthase (glutamine-hydrolyzing) [Desulfovibrio sp. JC010]NDV27165.1 asparagine synthase (glutamine-hydrolyzing) [Desulfovibrio sp. JC010]
MCGIAGYIGKERISETSINKCLELMDRRGPDGTGIYTHSYAQDRNVCLLHSRLSIIDLDERAAQPFKIGNEVITYNGELYNYKELAAELEKDGVAFRTESDTEVMLARLSRHGLEAIDSCEGMWAFAKYSEQSGELVLCRDRFGEKPLYIYEDARGLYFASEVKFLSALSGVKFTANAEHIQRFLVNGYKSIYKGNHGFYEGVEELKPAQLLKIDSKGTKETRPYWTPEFCPDESMSYEEAVATTREKLIESVKLRLRADVPLAFCMSGGVDSNSLISIAKKELDYDVHGFTIVSSDERYAEAELVKEVIKELGVKHTAIPLNTSGFLERMRKLVSYHDAPIYTISYYVHELLMDAIADNGYKVSISGTAADEIFSGYYDHYSLHMAEMHKQDGGLYETSLSDWNEHIKPIVRNPFLQDPQVFVKNPGERGHIYLNYEIFEEFLQQHFHEEFSEQRYCGDTMRSRMLNELCQEIVPVILHEDDMNAMYHSIENRSPFLDRNLVDFCNTIPTRHLIRDGYNKKVLRDAMKGIVPDSIIECRRKVGFNASILELLDVKDKAVREQLLDDSPIFEIVKRDKIEALLGETSMSNSFSKFLFSFLSCKMFLEECC